MFNLLYTEHIFKAGNIDNPFHKKVLLSTLTILGFVISTFATDFCFIKFSMVFSSSSYLYSSIVNAFLIANIITMSKIGNKISHAVVNLFRFNTNKFFLIKALSFEEEVPPYDIFFFSLEISPSIFFI